MSAIRPLKEQLHDVVYVYIADASSPVDIWGEMIKTIGGVHVRLTKEQAAALAEIHKFSGIPTYFVVNKEGKITYQEDKLSWSGNVKGATGICHALTFGPEQLRYRLCMVEIALSGSFNHTD